MRVAIPEDGGDAANGPEGATPAGEGGPLTTGGTRRETALARLAMGLVALHVLDDSFLQPERGTSAGDHLVSGLVPTALLVAAAVMYPRVRAGARAVLALAVGSCGIVGGAVEAGYHVANGRPSGDDYTGFLALAAGVALVALGTTTLWRSRRSAGSRRRRALRRALIGVAALLIAFWVAVPLLFSYGLTHFGRASVPEADLGAPHENVSFETAEGLELDGWYVPSKNGAVVVVLPAGGRGGPQEHARMLVRRGYGVLMFDLRGTGRSEGDPYRWAGGEDVEAALASLQGRSDVDPRMIGGLGLSLGGELMLETAAETEALRAVVSEGAGIRSIREQMDKPGADKWLSAPFWASVTVATAVFSNRAPPPDLEDLVARIAPRPVVLVYSGHPVGGEELNTPFLPRPESRRRSGGSATPATPPGSRRIRRNTSAGLWGSSTGPCSGRRP